MDNKIQTFLDNVCNHVNCKKVHKDIREELTCHIEDLTEKYCAQGFNWETSLSKAITAMGDSCELGRQLNKQHKPQTDWMLIGLMSIIVAFGGIVMYTSSKFETMQAVEFKFFMWYMAFGLLILFGVYFLDYTKLKGVAMPIYLAANIFLIVLFFYYNTFPGGMGFWLIGGSLGACKYASIMLIISFAGFIENRRNGGDKAFAELICLGLVPVVLIIALSHFAQAFVLAIGYGAQLTAALLKKHFGGSHKGQLAALCLTGIMAIVTLFIHSPYRLERLMLFIVGERAHPESVDGWLQNQVDILLAASKWVGGASDNIGVTGIERVVPSLTAEHALVNVIATLGWAAGITLVGAIGAFIIRLFITTAKIKNNYGSYLSFGICAVLTARFVLGVLINLNMFPLINIELPFISYGRTDYIVSMTFIGIILSIWRRNNILLEAI